MKLAWLLPAVVACSHAREPIVVKDGLHVVYAIDVDAMPDRAAGMARAVAVMQRRLDLARVTGTVAARGDKLEVDLAAASPEVIERAKEVLLYVGRLQLATVDDGTPFMVETAMAAKAKGIATRDDAWRSGEGEWHRDVYLLGSDRGELEHFVHGVRVPDDRQILFEHVRDGWRSYYVVRTGALQPAIEAAKVVTGDYGPQVVLSLDRDSTDRFAAMTKSIVGRKLASVLDGQVVNAPVVMTAITSGKLSMRPASDARPGEADQLAIVLGAGALPAPVVMETVSELRGGQVIPNPNP